MCTRRRHFLGTCIILSMTAGCLVGDALPSAERLRLIAPPRSDARVALVILPPLRGGGPAIERGDWTCSKCAKSNFRRRERYGVRERATRERYACEVLRARSHLHFFSASAGASSAIFNGLRDLLHLPRPRVSTIRCMRGAG